MVEANEKDGASDGNLWQAFLNDVSKRDFYATSQGDSHLLLLGDSQSGKRALIQAINKHCVKSKNKYIEVDQMGSAYSSIDALYLYVRDLADKDAASYMSQDEQTAAKLNIWCIKDPQRIELLKRMLKPEDLSKLCALVVTDFQEPWELMNSLQRWSSEVRNLASHFLKELPFSQQETMKNKLKNEVLTYEEPELDAEGKLIKKVAEKGNDENEEEEPDELKELKKELPLPEGVLKVNLGIPIVVAVTKADLLLHGDLRTFLDQNFDFIQKHLRQHCLTYAAGLFLVSNKTGTNVDVLYKYILYRLYGFEFSHKPQILEKHSLFIPTGFDSQNLINEVFKEEEGKEEVFEKIIQKPNQAVQADKDAIVCENWQQQLHQRVSTGEVAVSQAPSSQPAFQKSQTMTSDRNTMPADMNNTDKKKTINAFYENLMKGKQKGKEGAASGGAAPGQRMTGVTPAQRLQQLQQQKAQQQQQ